MSCKCSGPQQDTVFVGGYSKEHSPTKEDEAVLLKVKTEYIKRSGKNPGTFKAVSVITQDVSGTNYVFKVYLGGENYAHIGVFQPLGKNQPPELLVYRNNKKVDDKLEPI